MGMGSLKRIAALVVLATLAVCGLGAMSVGAITVPGTTVTVPSTPVQVQTPAVRVPSTAVTPPPAPKVTAPAPKPAVKVAPPKAPSPAPVVKQVTKPVNNVVKNTVPKATGTVKQTTGTATNTAGKATGTVTKAVPKATETVKKTTGTVKNVAGGGTVAGGGGGGDRPSGPSGPVDRILGTVLGGTGATGGTVRNAVGTIGGSTAAGGAGGGTATLVRSADGTTFLAVPGGGASGPGAGGFGGFGSFGGAAAGGGSLAAMLAGASSKQLRAVLEHLEGCMPALPAVDRQVISMRAGVNGRPLTRPQVGQRLGMSRETVRQTERRALNRLQYAAANTNCAGALVGPFDVAGIGNLMPQLLFAGPVPVSLSSGSLAAATTDPFAAARGIVSKSASPLFDLDSGGGGGPAWAIVLFTVLFSVSIAALTRELRSSF